MNVLKENQVIVINKLIELYKQGECEIIKILPVGGFNGFYDGGIHVFFDKEDNVSFIVVEEFSGTLCKVKVIGNK